MNNLVLVSIDRIYRCNGSTMRKASVECAILCCGLGYLAFWTDGWVQGAPFIVATFVYWVYLDMKTNKPRTPNPPPQINSKHV